MAGWHERSDEAAKALRADLEDHPDLTVKRLAGLAGCDESHIRHCLRGDRTIGVELLQAAFLDTRDCLLLNLILGGVRARISFLDDDDFTEPIVVSELLPRAAQALERAAAACRRVASAAADGRVGPEDRSLILEFEQLEAAAVGDLEAVRVAMRRMSRPRPCMEAR